MFEEFANTGGQAKSRRLDLSPTTWVAAQTESDAFSAKPLREAPPKSGPFSGMAEPPGPSEPAARFHAPHPHSPPRESEGLYKEAGKVLKSIRGFVSKNEEIIVIAVILLLLIDCDDDIELIIALLILFYPTISKRFFR